MEPLVELTEVSKRYGSVGAPPALDRISLSIPRGETTVVIGPSGSGKSTLLNLVGGLDRPSEGTIRVDGLDLTRLSETALARYRRARVGLIFQFFNLLDNLTVRDNVLIPAQLAGVSRRTAAGRADELMGLLGITEQAGQFPARLSGGQRQRVAIARALINRPALLLADEPTGALDRQTGASVIALFRELQEEGQTIVLVTHDPLLARQSGGRVVKVVDGRIAAEPALLEVEL